MNGPNNSVIEGRIDDVYLFWLPTRFEWVSAVWDGFSEQWAWGHYYPKATHTFDEATRKMVSRYLDRTGEVIYAP